MIQDILKEEVKNFRRFISTSSSEAAVSGTYIETDKQKRVTRQVEEAREQIRSNMFATAAGEVPPGMSPEQAFYNKYSNILPDKIGAPNVSRKFFTPGVKRFGAVGIGIGAALAMTGAIFGAMQAGTRMEEEPSLIRMNYQKWLDSQNQFYGTRGSGSYEWHESYRYSWWTQIYSYRLWLSIPRAHGCKLCIHGAGPIS